MPNIFKRFLQPNASDFVFPDVEELVEEEPADTAGEQEGEPEESAPEAEEKDMPMALDSLARQQSARAAGSGASSRITEEELEELGIPVNKPGENDMGLDFNDFLQLMVQQLQNQTIDNTTDTGEMLNQLVQMSTVQMLSSVKTGLETLVDASTLTYAASLVGKTVTVGQYDEDGKLQEIEGVVTGTGNYQGVPVIFVNDEMYPLNSIMAVGKLPEIPEEPEGPGEGGDGDGTGEGGENPPEESARTI